MGKEAVVRAKVGSQQGECTVYLEGAELLVRGPISAKFKFGEMSGLAVRDGALCFTCRGDAVELHIGGKAQAWLDAILNPRGRLEKLGIARGMNVCVIGKAEDDAVDEVAAALGSPPSRKASSPFDVALLFAHEPAELAPLLSLAPMLAEKGAIWVLWPKGRKDFAHEDVVAAGKKAGLSQTRSMGFSAALTGLRLVRAKGSSAPKERPSAKSAVRSAKKISKKPSPVRTGRSRAGQKSARASKPRTTRSRPRPR